MEKVGRAHKAAMESKDREQIAQAEAERKKLLEPVYVLFNQMDERLKALLTSVQMERSGTRQTDAGQRPDPLGFGTDASDKASDSPGDKSAGSPTPKPQTPATTP